MADTIYRGQRVIVHESISGAGWYAMLGGGRTNEAYYATADEAMAVAKREIDREMDQ